MSGEVLVSAENVSKKFCKSLKRSLWYGVKDLASEVFVRRSFNFTDNELRMDEFWAVKNISFELRRGECIGLIGQNGAGKSTLLKMLNGLLKPNGGRISMKGRVGALISLGIGFNPILTGRENIYVNGSILGFTKSEIDRKFDEIVDFSELKEFIDMPVKNYSSGMNVRLGFSIASHMEPDVLLLDEVLAVGDVGFKAKSFNAMTKIAKNTAVVFVTHSMPMLSRIASRVLVLENGVQLYQGTDVAKGIEEYLDCFEGEQTQIIGEENVRLYEVKFGNVASEDSHGIPTIEYGSDLVVNLKFRVIRDGVDVFTVFFQIMDMNLRVIAQCYSVSSNVEFKNTGDMRVRVRIPNLLLTSSTYSLSVGFLENKVDDLRGYTLAGFKAIKQFRVVGATVPEHSSFQLLGEWDQVQ